MPKNTDKTEEKKRNNYSFSIKKTDSPIIREFVEKQSNFSESFRYLILKFCRENGVQDISNLLTEYMYFNDNQTPIKKTYNHEIIKEEVTDELIEETDDNLNGVSSEVIKDDKNNENDVTDNYDEIPECYRTKK